MENKYRKPTSSDLAEITPKLKKMWYKIAESFPADCNAFWPKWGFVHIRSPKVSGQVLVTGKSSELSLKAEMKCHSVIENDPVCQGCVLKRGVVYHL